jgi:hypothetical protein
MRAGESDVGFLRDYFGIRVQEIADYRDLPNWLCELEKRINGRRLRRLSWDFGLRGAGAIDRSVDSGRLEIVRSALPEPPASDEWVVFSAGGSSGRPQISSVGLEVLQRYGLDPNGFELLSGHGAGSAFVWAHSADRRFIGVNARVDPWTRAGAEMRPVDPLRWPINRTASRTTAGGRARRDLRIIPTAVQELMSAAQKSGVKRVHSVLLASGKLRTFPQSFGLCQMVRGWAKWRAACEEAAAGLSIFVTAPEVLYNLDAGRLDFSAYLRFDFLEFWVEIVKSGGGTERYLHSCSASEPILQVLREFAIEEKHWTLELVPAPCLEWGRWSISGVHAWEDTFARPLTVETFGILPGSMLRVLQPEQRQEERRPLV